MDATQIKATYVLSARCLRHVLDCYEAWLQENGNARPLTLQEFTETVYMPAMAAALVKACPQANITMPGSSLPVVASM